MGIRSEEGVPSGPLFLLISSTDLVKSATAGIIHFSLKNLPFKHL